MITEIHASGGSIRIERDGRVNRSVGDDLASFNSLFRSRLSGTKPEEILQMNSIKKSQLVDSSQYFCLSGGDPRTRFISIIGRLVTETPGCVTVAIDKNEAVSQEWVSLLSRAARISDNSQFDIGISFDCRDHWLIQIWATN